MNTPSQKGTRFGPGHSKGPQAESAGPARAGSTRGWMAAGALLMQGGVHELDAGQELGLSRFSLAGAAAPQRALNVQLKGLGGGQPERAERCIC